MKFPNFRETGHRPPVRWLWLAAFLPLWELLRVITGASPLLMPPLQEIFRALCTGLFAGELGLRWLSSMGLVFAGLGAGTVLALVLAVLSTSGSAMRSFLSVCASVLHPLPGIALLPLIILWLGTGVPAVLFIIVHAVLWPIYVNMESGIRAVDPSWTAYARNLRLNRGKTFFRIILPGTFPHLISGMRTGWARSWRALVAAEMVFGAVGRLGGLGWQVFESRVMMDSPDLYAGIVVIMVTGIAVEEGVFSRWENRILRRWGKA